MSLRSKYIYLYQFLATIELLYINLTLCVYFDPFTDNYYNYELHIAYMYLFVAQITITATLYATYI